MPKEYELKYKNYKKDEVINKLLKFLNLIGNESIDFYNNMTKSFLDVPEYIYNNPLKFLINKIWENNKIDKINSDFTNELKLIYDLTETNNIYSGLLYSDKFSIIKYGVESESYYYEWNYDNENILNGGEISNGLYAYDPIINQASSIC